MPHKKYWQGVPSSYHLVDVDSKFLELSQKKLLESNITVLKHFIKRDELPNIDNESLDVIFTFYSLEHLADLEDSLSFYFSKLKKGGRLVGAIPNEGGVAWGLGRLLTSRRFVIKNSRINYDKIICWEHCNYCDDILEKIVKAGFKIKRQFGYPFGTFFPKDLNLVSSFICTKL